VEIKTEVRKYVADNFLPDASVESISDDMPLITGGIIDSIGMLGLVDFLESRYEIEFMPREIDVHSLDTLAQIEELIQRKLSGWKPNAINGNG
jgi:acyl carrier protein